MTLLEQARAITPSTRKTSPSVPLEQVEVLVEYALGRLTTRQACTVFGMSCKSGTDSRLSWMILRAIRAGLITASIADQNGGKP